MKIRNDFASASIYLERLLLFGHVFHENNVEHWSHLKNREDFKNIFMLEDEVRYKFEKVYSVGRDLAVYMSRQLDTFNDPSEHPTLTSYVNSFDDSWLSQIDQLREISQIAKDEKKKLQYSCPWAVEQMIILFDKQISLLQDITGTLNIIKTTDIYKIESAGRVMEKPTVTVQGDYLSFQNISTEGNGQVFIGKFNEVVANLKNSGQADFAKAIKTLEEAVLASTHISDDEKKEHIEVINQIGNEAAKEKPNKILIKAMSEGLLSILKAIPDIAKVAVAVAPFFPH